MCRQTAKYFFNVKVQKGLKTQKLLVINWSFLAAQWCALLPHSEKLQGVNPPADWRLSMWRMHIFPSWAYLITIVK